MNSLKNKSTILIIVALIVVCGGSFLGIRALNNNTDAQTTAQSYSYQSEYTSTTKPLYTSQPQQVVDIDLDVPTTKPTATTNGSVTTSYASNLITTFPMVPGGTTTTAPVQTTTTTPTLVADGQTTTRNITTTSATTQKQNTVIEDKGLAGYLFDDEGNFFFTSDDPWQRNFGYNEAFDIAAPFAVFYYDTMRCKFKYDNKDWMIQFWKGQYGLAFVGVEIGVYTKPFDRDVNHYDAASDEDALYMSMTGYRHNQVIFSREYSKYWWCTGFIPGQLEKFSDRSEIAVKCRITMKDSDMLSGFVTSLKENNLVEGRHYTVNGLDVFITWQ